MRGDQLWNVFVNESNVNYYVIHSLQILSINDRNIPASDKQSDKVKLMKPWPPCHCRNIKKRCWGEQINKIIINNVGYLISTWNHRLIRLMLELKHQRRCTAEKTLNEQGSRTCLFITRKAANSMTNLTKFLTYFHISPTDLLRRHCWVKSHGARRDYTGLST